MRRKNSEHIRFSDGVSVSFENVFISNFSKLVVFASKYLENPSVCEDVVQETFMYLWDSEMLFSTELSLVAFMYKTVRNKSLNIIKHKKIKDKYSEENLERLESNKYFIDNIMSEEFSDLLYKAINNLTDQCREVVIMHLKGLKNNEIAENLEIAIPTVKSHKSIAYRQLRVQLKDEYELF